MNTLKINVPEGYEIDEDKSTFDEIVFKPIGRVLPKTFKELDEINPDFVENHKYYRAYKYSFRDSTEEAFFFTNNP